MANMSYCRFQNTLHDMGDCHIALETLIERDPEQRHNPSLSADELEAAQHLAFLCLSILETLGEACGHDTYVTLDGPTPAELVNTINARAVEAFVRKVSEG